MEFQGFTVNTLNQSQAFVKNVINFIEIEFCKQNARAIDQFTGVFLYKPLVCNFKVCLLQAKTTSRN